MTPEQKAHRAQAQRALWANASYAATQRAAHTRHVIAIGSHGHHKPDRTCPCGPVAAVPVVGGDVTVFMHRVPPDPHDEQRRLRWPVAVRRQLDRATRVEY
jgi:hypothetical protein